MQLPHSKSLRVYTFTNVDASVNRAMVKSANVKLFKQAEEYTRNKYQISDLKFTPVRYSPPYFDQSIFGKMGSMVGFTSTLLKTPMQFLNMDDLDHSLGALKIQAT